MESEFGRWSQLRTHPRRCLRIGIDRRGWEKEKLRFLFGGRPGHHAGHPREPRADQLPSKTPRLRSYLGAGHSPNSIRLESIPRAYRNERHRTNEEFDSGLQTVEEGPGPVSFRRLRFASGAA